MKVTNFDVTGLRFDQEHFIPKAGFSVGFIDDTGYYGRDFSNKQSAIEEFNNISESAIAEHITFIEVVNLSSNTTVQNQKIYDYSNN